VSKPPVCCDAARSANPHDFYKPWFTDLVAVNPGYNKPSSRSEHVFVQRRPAVENARSKEVFKTQAVLVEKADHISHLNCS